LSLFHPGRWELGLRHGQQRIMLVCCHSHQAAGSAPVSHR
jgi:hypothetical protein